MPDNPNKKCSPYPLLNQKRTIYTGKSLVGYMKTMPSTSKSSDEFSVLEALDC